MSKVDLLFLAKNRLEFTKESFSILLENTDRSLLGRFDVYDDGSVDGTAEYLETLCALSQVRFQNTEYTSPVLAFNAFIQETAESGAKFVAKIDADTACCANWLSVCIQILEDHPELDCLGIEAFTPINTDVSIKRTYESYGYTGGIGVFRREAFKSFPASRSTYFGLQTWQQAKRLKCGWLQPSLPIFLLDHLPFEPWLSLSKSYIEKKWQRRQWGIYGEPRKEGFHAHGSELWSWRFPDEELKPIVLELSQIEQRRQRGKKRQEAVATAAKELRASRESARLARAHAWSKDGLERKALLEESQKHIEIAIIIPSRTDSHLDLFLKSLEISQPGYVCNIFVADDGLSEGFKARHPEIRFIACPQPFVFARNVNLAVQAALEENPDTHILIQNDDTQVVSPRFLDNLKELIPQMIVSKWAIASPQILGACGNQVLKRPTRSNALTQIGGETVPFISVLITSPAWRALGPLDERFVAFGWEDVAWCFKARQAGFKLGWTSALKVRHEGSATFKQDHGEKLLDSMSTEAREVFFRHYNHPLSKTFVKA